MLSYDISQGRLFCLLIDQETMLFAELPGGPRVFERSTIIKLMSVYKN